MWQLSYRRQIFWSTECAVGDISELVLHLKPLKKVVDYQHSLLVINGVFGLGILGIIIPILMILHLFDKDNDLPCIPGEGEQEKKNLNTIKAVLSFISKIAKMIPLILCLVVTDDIHWFFTTSGESNCSDSLTNQAMSQLGEQIDDVKKSNYNTLYIDIAMICWGIVSFLWWIYKKYGKKQEGEKKDVTKGDGEKMNENGYEQPAEQQHSVQLVQPVHLVQPGQIQQAAPMVVPVMVVGEQPPVQFVQQVPISQPMYVQPQVLQNQQQQNKQNEPGQKDPNAQYYYN